MTAPAAPQVGLVRLDQVVFHPHNVRHNLGDLRSLTASITRHGVMQPIVVEKHAGRLRLRAGHRRVAAAKIAGLARVPAVIHDEALDDDEWLIASVQENVIRASLSSQERDRTVQVLLDLGCSRDGVAETFGVAKKTVDSWLSQSPEQQTRRRAVDSQRIRIYASTIRGHLRDWRARDADRDTILVELEALITPTLDQDPRGPA